MKVKLTLIMVSAFILLSFFAGCSKSERTEIKPTPTLVIESDIKFEGSAGALEGENAPITSDNSANPLTPDLINTVSPEQTVCPTVDPTLMPTPTSQPTPEVEMSMDNNEGSMGELE